MCRILPLVLTFMFINCHARVKSLELKKINVVFFLEESDELSELAIKSSANIVNYHTKSTRYFLHPIIYKYRRSDVIDLSFIVCELLGHGVAAIFGPEQPETNEIIQSVSLSLEIPQFQTFWNPNLEAFSKLSQDDGANGVFNFGLHPSPGTFSLALATLVRENDWKSYTVIYENDDGLVRLQEVLKAQNPPELAVTYRKLEPGPDHRRILKQIKASGATNIILDCEAHHIINILLQAKEIKLVEGYHSYIITSLDAYTIDFSFLGDIKANITTFSVLDKTVLDTVIGNWELADTSQQTELSWKAITTRTALMYDAFNLFITAFAELDSAQELIVSPLSCELRETSTHGYRLASYIAMRNLTRGMLQGPLTGPVAFNSFGIRSSFRLEIVELTRHGSRVTGKWDSDSPNVIVNTIPVEDREREMYKQLAGRNFKVVSRLGPPYLSRRIPKAGEYFYGNDVFEGYSLDLMHEICHHLNCTYTFEIVPDNNYGNYDHEKKEWNGLIRHLLDRKADLAVCDLTTTSERRKAVDFSNPFMTLGISIIFAKAVKPPPELLSFTNPFSLDIWLYMSTSYILITIVVYLIARLNPNEWENPHPCDQSPRELENIWDLKNCFWLTMGSLMCAGCDLLPKGISTRVVIGMWWFFSMIIMNASYTANLAAFLTMERMGPTISSAENMASQSKVKYGCVEGASTASFFKDSNDSIYHKMWVQMESSYPSVFEKSNEDGVKRVMTNKGRYAFLMESTTIEYQMERHCDLVQVGGKLDIKGYGIAMPTNAEYRTAINQAILKMQESGKLRMLKHRWWKEKNKGEDCSVGDLASSKTSDTNEMGLSHVGGVFVVLGGGIAIALVIAVLEFLWNVRKVAVSQKMTPKEAFVQEMKFAMNIWERKKVVRPPPSDSNLNLEIVKKE